MLKYCWRIEKMFKVSWRDNLPRGNGRWRMKRKAERMQRWSDFDNLIARVMEKVSANEV